MKRIALLTLLVLASFIYAQAQISSRTAFGVRSVATLPAACVYNLVGRVDEVYKTGASAGFYTCNSSGNGWNGPYPTSGSGGTPGGSVGQVQFNDTGGVFGGTSLFTIDKTTGHLAIGSGSVLGRDFINAQETWTSTQFKRGLLVYQTLNPTAPGSGGLATALRVITAGNQNQGSLGVASNYIVHGSTGTVDEIIVGEFETDLSEGSGNVGTIYGSKISLDHEGAGIVADNYGLFIDTPVGASAATNFVNNTAIYIADQSAVGTSSAINLLSKGATSKNIFEGLIQNSTLTASSAVATDASKNLVSVATTGTGNVVRASSPSLTTPNLGTPSAINLTNATAVPACATCVTSAASLTSTAIMTGAGSQGSQTPNGSATLNASGDVSLPGKLSTGVGGSVAGLIGVSQGTAQSVIANTVGLTAPTSVTGYNILYPAAAATGIGHYANSSNTVTMSVSAVVESDITLADNTTNNSSTSNHGFLKKLDNNAAHYMDGTGNWGTPGGSGTVNSGSQYQIGYYATAGTAISGNANLTTDSSNSLIVGTSPDVGICRSAAGVLGVNDGSGTCTNYATAKGVAFIVTDFTNTTGGTTAPQTINKRLFSVNFAASDASKVVTNSTVSSSSIPMCQVLTNDATMKSIQVVVGSGTMTIYPNAVPTAETRVGCLIPN